MKGVFLNVLSLTFLICALIESIATAEDDTKLVLLQMLFRHGDRTPTYIYPNDLHGEAPWKIYGGLGQLTQKGMLQHYNYGKYLRRMYDDFLNETYNRERVIVKSTKYDRTMMSAQSLLASLYKPVDYQIWTDELKWQPIPVHTADIDNVFIPNCDRLSQLTNEAFSCEQAKKENENFKDLIDVANRETGLTNNSITNLYRLADLFMIEKNNNLTLPQWAIDNYDKLMKTLDLAFSFKFLTMEMAKLQAGGVLNDIRTNIKTATNGGLSLELALFSAVGKHSIMHDTYIAAMIKLLVLRNEIIAPPYVSSVIFELRKSKVGSNYYVKVFTKLNPPDEPIKIVLATISGCSELCPLEDFMRITADKVVDNPTQACAKHSGGFKPLSLLYNLTFMISMGFVFTCTVLTILCSVHTYRRVFRNRSGYMQQEL